MKDGTLLGCGAAVPRPNRAIFPIYSSSLPKEAAGRILDTIGKYEQTLTVANHDKATYKLSVTSPPPEFMEVEIASAEVPAEGVAEVVLKAGDDTPIGVYSGSLTLHFEGPRTFSVTVPIYGMGYRR